MCSAASRGWGRKNLQGRLRLASCLDELKPGSYPLIYTFIHYLFSLYLLSTSYVIETMQGMVILSQIRYGPCYIYGSLYVTLNISFV